MATDIQQKKFDKFQESQLRHEAIDFVRAAIAAAGLAESERGVTWGVTVCPDNETIIRLNVGNIAQLSVRYGRVAKKDPAGSRERIAVAVRKRALGWMGIPGSLSDQEGFPDWVDDSIILRGYFDQWASRFFKKKRLALAFAEHVREAHKKMPDANWHNPLVDALLS